VFLYIVNISRLVDNAAGSTQLNSSLGELCDWKSFRRYRICNL